MGSPPKKPDGALVFRQDRRKLFGAAIIAVVFVVMGCSFISNPGFWTTTRHPSSSYIEVVGWITAPFFSLALAAVAMSLVRPVTLTLGPEGVTVSTVWKTYSRPWHAIGNFRIWSNAGNRMVVFDDVAPPNPRLAEVSRRISGATGALPTCLNVSPDDLLAQVKTAQEQWTADAVRASAS